MQNATGEYVIHCNLDDWVDLSLFSSMYDKVVKERAEIVICDFFHVYDTVCYFRIIRVLLMIL